MKKLHWFVAPVALVAFALLAACGGDSDDGPEPASSGAQGAVSASATAATEATPTSAPPSASPASSGATGAANPPQSGQGVTRDNALDVAAFAKSLEALESFRFNFKLNMDFDMPEADSNDEGAALAAMLLALFANFEVEGTFQAPDRVAVTANIFGSEIQTITIGDESWTNDGSGWVAGDGDAGFNFEMPFEFNPSEGLPFEFLPAEVLEGGVVTDEDVNGEDTTRYSFDKQSLASLAETLGEEAGLEDIEDFDSLNLDVWVTDEGIPVKMLVSVAGESEGTDMAIDLEFNITDLNDDSITIDRPI